jgi:pimeloyl-ACP methyl ester carboxylesterase
MRESVKCLKAESSFQGGKAKFTAIFHDWGVIAGSQYTNRILEDVNADLTPDQLVLFDVLLPPHPKTENKPVVPKDTFRETAITISYRAAFASSFWIRRYISKSLAQVNFIFTSMILGLFGLNPCFDIDSKPIRDRKNPISLDRLVYMAYPYYNAFKALFTGTLKEVQSGASLPLDLKQTPVLYMYGTYKNIHFHDKSAFKLLQNEAEEGRRSKVVAVEDAGHFLYPQKPDICLEEVKKFIEDA